VIIIGAAGRDFHNFNVVFRDRKEFEVVAFTATQIPYISDRRYPKQLSGRRYPKGIQIYDESELAKLIRRLKADACILAYSDLSYATVMDKASLVNAAGADFWLIAPEHTMIPSRKPLIAVCAVRTGSGKSQTTQYISLKLRELGLTPVIVRHPMPYGNLRKQAVQRYGELADLDKNECTIEEREDYEAHIRNGFVLYSGVDYGAILREAEKEADVVIWDGGNNDAPFYRPDLFITVADPLRAGNEMTYYPGNICARMANVLLINKVNSATAEQMDLVTRNLRSINPQAVIVNANSVVKADNPELIRGKKVLIIEDGPTITHGNMPFGAGTIAAKQYGAREIAIAKDYAVGSIKATFQKYPHLSRELPAMGYSPGQIRDLETTINRADCDSVISATPTDLRPLLQANKPIAQVTYDLEPVGRVFDDTIVRFAKKAKRTGRKH
jgi:predicted GTPase